jgi:carbon monoxide dehydrogenase subunit G
VELRHRFTVPAGAAETWATFDDVEQVAGCFPGATVTDVDGDEFKGSCKVKLGPIALVYNGSGRFVEKDQAGGRMVLEAKGKDKRGNGTASATVTASFAEAAGTTEVEVVTDLSITGKPAQFGRGVIQDVSDKLLGQFVDCLESRLSEPPTEPIPATPGEPVAAPPAAAAPGEEPGQAPRQVDVLDLGATALPIVLKAYWKQLAAIAALLLVLRRLLRRRR